MIAPVLSARRSVGAPQSHAFIAGLATIAMAASAAVLHFVLRFATDVPLGDDWDLLRTLSTWQADGLTANSLFAFHNEHRIVATRMLYWFLLPVIHGNLKTAMLFNAGLVVATLVVVSTFFATGSVHPLFRLFSFAGVAALVSGWFQWQNFLWSFQLPWLLLPLLLVLSIWSVHHIADAAIATSVVSGILLVSLACQANGVIVWLAVRPPYLLRTRGMPPLRRAALPALLTTCIAVATALYFMDLPARTRPSPIAAIVDSPVRFAHFFLAALGSPFSAPLSLLGDERWIGSTSGAIGVMVAVALVLAAWNDRRLEKRQALLGLASGFVIFGLVSVLAIAAGRFEQVSADRIESRYTTFALYFFAGSLLFLYLVATRERPVGRMTGALRLSLLLVCVGTSVGSTWGNDLFVQHGTNLRLAQSRIRASLQLSDALPDRPELASEIHTVSIERLPALLTAFENGGLWHARRWDVRAADQLQTLAAVGNVDDVEDRGDSVVVRGWARLPNALPADAVLALRRGDGRDLIPVAMSQRERASRPDVASRFDAGTLRDSGWTLVLSKVEYLLHPSIVAYSAADERLYSIPVEWKVFPD